MIYDLAENLGRSVCELLDMPVAEFMVWYLRFKKRAEANAVRK